MKYIFETNSEKEAKAIMNSKRTDYIINSLEDFCDSLDKDSNSAIYGSYGRRFVPINKLNMDELRAKNIEVKKYIDIDDVITYIEGLLDKYQDEN